MMFLHADSQLPSHYDTMAWHTLVKPGIAAGAFQFGLDVVHMEEKRLIQHNIYIDLSLSLSQQKKNIMVVSATNETIGVGYSQTFIKNGLVFQQRS